MNNAMRIEVERQLIKKWQNVSSFEISKFFSTKLPNKMDEIQQKQFLEDLTLLIVKSHLLVHFLESLWLKRFVLQLNPHIVFPSIKTFSSDILPNLVKKTKDVYVLPKLFRCGLATASFNLWVSKNTYEIFALAINFLNENWQPNKVTLNLFEATNITSQALTKNLSELLDSYGLRKKIISYGKYEGINVNSMTISLKSIINCDILGLEESLDG